ncbi:glial fibrillary acidic protein-like isoform X2 [Clavelina lepadiformis]|uniref:glial fibrillary acidic protein-like isoform X2 n=1 Tax=Clavelina lepadiformis TaxID=159417 RepID=UPI004041D265
MEAQSEKKVSVQKISIGTSSKTVERTASKKSYSSNSNNSNMSRLSSPKVQASSYQLRYGARNRNFSFSPRRAGAVEATVTRVTVSDGLELTPALISSRAEEKAALGSLNDRFVSYIDKVRSLLTRNQLLEAKVKQLESVRIVPSRAGDIYDERLQQLQRDYEDVMLAKSKVEIELENAYREVDDFRKQLEREIEDRKEAEDEATSLRKDVDQATLDRVELEGRVESLREELDLVRRASDEDIRALTEQLAVMNTGEVVVDGPQTTDLSESLRDLRSAYEQLTQNNKVEIEHFYKSKIADLSNQVKNENNASKNSKTEILEVKRQYQSVTVELEGLRNTNAALETQLEECESRYHNDMTKLQNTASNLEEELQDARDKSQKQLVDYNALLNVKLSLDLEIQTYRKLLEGEEIRMDKTSAGEIKLEGSVTKRTITDISKNESTSRNVVDNELVDMLSEVVEDFKSESSS